MSASQNRIVRTPPPPPATHPHVQILQQQDADRRLCPIDRTPLTQTSADAYPVNFAIVEVIGALPPGDATDAQPAAAQPGGPPLLPAFPLHRAPLLAAPAPDVSFAEVLPGGNFWDITDAVWQRIEAAYKLPRSTVDGSPADWDVLGWTSSGHCAYRGVRHACITCRRVIVWLQWTERFRVSGDTSVGDSTRHHTARHTSPFPLSHSRGPELQQSGQGAIGCSGCWGGSVGGCCIEVKTPCSDAVSHAACCATGFNKSTPGMPSAVALCYAATLPGTDNVSVRVLQSQRALRAAVAPHVALQLLPDVRPLLPTLHGYVITSAADADADADAGAGDGRGDQQAWLAYSLQGNCLAQHLEAQPGHYLPLNSVVCLTVAPCAEACETIMKSPPCAETSRPARMVARCRPSLNRPPSAHAST